MRCAARRLQKDGFAWHVCEVWKASLPSKESLWKSRSGKNVACIPVTEKIKIFFVPGINVPGFFFDRINEQDLAGLLVGKEEC